MRVAKFTAPAAVALSVTMLLGAPRAARADGAFPDAQIILAPANKPDELMLVTNFGLLTSEDAGRSWTWSCEQTENAFGLYYQVGATTRPRLFTVAGKRVLFSEDRSCGWAVAGGMLAGQDISDVWVDRVVTDRVLAIGATCCQAGLMTYGIFASSNGGTTFDSALFQAAPGATITGIESASSDGKTIYATLAGAPPDGGKPPPVLARTRDGGATWTLTDLTASLGAGGVRLVAVDPASADKVFLLWSDANGQALAVTEDGGATFTKPFVPDGVVKAFLRLADGTVLVATDTSTIAGLYRSRDGAKTFTAVDAPPHVRGLAERAGVVYAATDNFSEGYAVGASTDGGTTWKAVMAYADVGAIAPCLKAACQTTCAAEADLALWSADVCAADPSGAGGGGGMSVDAGSGGAPGPHDAGVDAAGGASGTGGTHGGGGCAVAPPGRQALGAALAAVIALALVLRARARARGEL